LVTPLIAETTATMGPSAAAPLTIFATRAMHEASPTDVPPNFITRNGFFMYQEDRAQSNSKWPDAKTTRRLRWPRLQKLYTMRPNPREACCVGVSS